MQTNPQFLFFLAGILSLTLTACAGISEKKTSTTDATPEAPSEALKADVEIGKVVLIDGTSDVFYISEALAQEFMKKNPDAKVVVGISNSGVGFKKFCIGDTDINNASRPINKAEIDLCKANGIEFVEIPFAFDGITLVVNRDNSWASCLNVKDLGKIWEPTAQGKVTKWKQVREDFPDVEIKIFGPEKDSGTYDYFTDITTGGGNQSRTDYTSIDDNDEIVNGVQSDKGGFGILNFASYQKNKDFLKVVAIDNGTGENKAGTCVPPSQETISKGTYNTLARPLFFYINKEALKKRPAVKLFADYQIRPDNASVIAKAGGVPLPANFQAKVRQRLGNLTTGSIFEGDASGGISISDKLDNNAQK